MHTFLLLLFLAIPTAIFAGQNSTKVEIHFLSLSSQQVPLYMIIVISLLIGVAFSLLIDAANIFSRSRIIKGKDHELKERKQENTQLAKQLHEEEIENEELKEKYAPGIVDEKAI